MNFRDAYRDDLKEAFFDTDEFASEHVIDGKPMKVLLTKVNLQDARKARDGAKASLNPKERAINKAAMILRIREEDIDRKLTVNAVINLDGENMWINEVEHMEGMYRLLVGKYKV